MRTIPTHYDLIPDRYFTGNILDIGSRDGSNQKISSQWPLIETAIQSNRYLTIDIEGFPFVDIVGDVFDVLPDMIKQNMIFDTVIANHILEHIQYERWEELIGYMKELVASHGTLIIGTPYLEVPPIEYRVIGPDHLKHRVHWIDCRHFVRLLGDTCTFRVYRGPYSMAILCFWRKVEK